MRLVLGLAISVAVLIWIASVQEDGRSAEGGPIKVSGRTAEIEARAEFRMQIERCRVDRTACPKSLAGDREGFRRVSESGYDYGDCNGLFLAVVLFPEPCELVRRVDPPETEEVGAR